MDKCFFTGISSEEEPLYDVIYDGNVVKASKAAVEDMGLMVLRKPKEFNLEEVNKRQSVYDRLSRMSGVDQKSFLKQKRPDNEEVRKDISARQKNVTLRDIVERKYKEDKKNEIIEPRKDLVDNFHWIIMRVRRIKKVTQEQMAKEMNVTVDSIKNAEKGIIGKDDRFVNMLERYLNVKLFNDERSYIKMPVPEPVRDAPRASPSAEPNKELTIAQLKEMSEKYKETKINEPYGNPYEVEEEMNEEVEYEREQADKQISDFGKDKKELSRDGMRDLIFRKKR